MDTWSAGAILCAFVAGRPTKGVKAIYKFVPTFFCHLTYADAVSPRSIRDNVYDFPSHASPSANAQQIRAPDPSSRPALYSIPVPKAVSDANLQRLRKLEDAETYINAPHRNAELEPPVPSTSSSNTSIEAQQDARSHPVSLNKRRGSKRLPSLNCLSQPCYRLPTNCCSSLFKEMRAGREQPQGANPDGSNVGEDKGEEGE